MNLFGRALAAIAPLFGLIAFGYFAKRLQILPDGDAAAFNRLVVQITLPAFVLAALLTHTFETAYLRAPLVIWIGQGMVFALALALGRLCHWERKKTGAILLTGTFGNTGFLGYPMTTALFPVLLPVSVLIDQLGMALWLYPGALVLGALYGGQARKHPSAAITGFLRSPLFVALALGLALRFLPHGGLTVPRALTIAGGMGLSVIALVGSATIPVVLIAIGLMLRPSTLPHHGRDVLLIGGLKLILLPTMAWLAARYLFDLRGDLLRVCVLEAAMPPSASATVFAGEFGMDGGLAVAAFFALTLASALTMPLMLALLR